MPWTWKCLHFRSFLCIFWTSNYSADGNKSKSVCLGKEKFLSLFYMDVVVSASKEVSTHSQLSQELAFIWQRFENPKFLKTWKQELHALSCFLIVISFLAPESARVNSVTLHLFPQIFRGSIHLMESSSTIALPSYLFSRIFVWLRKNLRCDRQKTETKLVLMKLESITLLDLLHPLTRSMQQLHSCYAQTAWNSGCREPIEYSQPTGLVQVEAIMTLCLKTN